MNADLVAIELDALSANTGRLHLLEEATTDVRRERDRQVLALARDGVPYAAIARAAGISDRAVSKLARAAGIQRYPRRRR